MRDDHEQHHSVAKELETAGWYAIAEDVREHGVAVTLSRVRTMDREWPEEFAEPVEILEGFDGADTAKP